MKHLMPLIVSVALAPAARAQSPAEMLSAAETKMEAAISGLKQDLAAIGETRVTSSTFSRVFVNYYGTPTPVPQLASIHIPEPRLVLIQPYDRQMLTPIANAINSTLGLPAGNDGTTVRVTVPATDDATRKTYVKTANARGEETKIAIRNIRRLTYDQLNKALKNGTATDADVTRAERDLNNLTQKYVARADETVKQKVQQLLAA